MSRAVALLIVTSCLLPVGTRASEIPKQGTANYTTFFVTTASQAMTLGTRSYSTYGLNGVTRNDEGAEIFNNMGVRCLGSREVDGDDIRVEGACTERDKDGDQVFQTYQARGKTTGGGIAGTHLLVGGTGKYAGITGKADYTIQVVTGPDNVRMPVVHDHATWTRP